MFQVDLSEDDRKMREWKDRLQAEVGLTEEASENLSTTIYREVLNSNPTDILPPDVISYADRLNEVALFMNWSAESRLFEPNPLWDHAKLVLSYYVCFVYLGETCFIRLRKLLRSTATGRCCNYLTENPVRAFRNAIAHGNWQIGNGVIHFWARKGNDPNEYLFKFEVPDQDIQFWFFLSLCVGKSAFAALTERSKGEWPTPAP